jgi:hypothetical protein
MTVKELMGELTQYPEDMKVYIEIPRRKLYQPLHEFDVMERWLWDGSEYCVCLRRGKLFK